MRFANTGYSTPVLVVYPKYYVKTKGHALKKSWISVVDQTAHSFAGLSKSWNPAKSYYLLLGLYRDERPALLDVTEHFPEDLVEIQISQIKNLKALDTMLKE